MELRSGVTLSALKRAGHADGRPARRPQVDPVLQPGPAGASRQPERPAIKEIDEAANRGNVTIHVIDPRPLGSVGFGGDDDPAAASPPTPAAAPSSAPTIPKEHLRAVMADASAYYLVGYTPTRASQRRQVPRDQGSKVKRRGVHVTARRGYWAASEKELTAAAEAAATPVNVGAHDGARRRCPIPASGRAVTFGPALSKGDEERTRADVYVGSRIRLRHRRQAGASRRFSRSMTPARRSMPAQVIGGAPGELPMMAHFRVAGGRHRLRFTSLTAKGETDRSLGADRRWCPTSQRAASCWRRRKFLRARNMIELRAIEANPTPSPTALDAVWPHRSRAGGDRVPGAGGRDTADQGRSAERARVTCCAHSTRRRWPTAACACRCRWRASPTAPTFSCATATAGEHTRRAVGRVPRRAMTAVQDWRV